MDVVRAVRLAIARPGAWLLLVVTLALGIAAPTIALTFADAVLWHPLPFRNAERLVRVRASVSPDVLRQSASAERWLDGLFPWGMEGATVDTGRGAEGATIGDISRGLFEALGVAPARGRAFADNEFTPGSHVVLASAALGAELRAMAPNRDSWTVRIDGVAETVIGVMPEGFDFPIGRVLLWRPLPASVAAPTVAVGILKPGVAATDPSIAAKDAWPGRGTVTPFVTVTSATLSAVSAFAGASVLVFLIALANAAGLQVAQAVERRGELAVRAALGASTRQLARTLVVETAVSAIAACLLAVLLSALVIPLIVRAVPYVFAFQSLRPVRLDARAFGVATITSFLAAAGAAAMSIWRLRYVQPKTAFDAHGVAGGSPTRTRRALAALAIAIAVPILSSAALLATSLRHLTDIDPGFKTDPILQVILDLPAWRFTSEAARREGLAHLRDTLTAVPGVAAVSIAMPPPFLDRTPLAPFVVDGRADSPGSGAVAYDAIDESFFTTTGISLSGGRTFDGRDTDSSERVAIVGRALAQRLWPNASPLGQRFKSSADGPWRTVVGIADDVTTVGTDRSRSALAFYLPATQTPASELANVMIRVQTTDAGALARSVRDAIRAALPDVPIIDLGRLSDELTSDFARERFVTGMVSALGFAALGLALVGTYAMFWTSVQSRRREIGIRLALGATRGRVMRAVLNESAFIAGAGLAMGLPLAFATSRMLSAWLFQLSPADPATHAIVATAVLVSALAAASGPARRAARVDPAIALRQS